MMFLYEIFFVLVTVSDEFDISTCGIEKGCILQPNNCNPLSATSCDKAFSYQVDGDYLVIELMGRVDDPAASYVAVAFSNDQAMGNDSVTECSATINQPLKGRLSYNLLNENLRVPAPQYILDQILITVSAEYRDGKYFCLLRQRVIPPTSIPADQVKPLNDNYYILLATGPTSTLAAAQPYYGVNGYVNPLNLEDPSTRLGGNVYVSPSYQRNVYDLPYNAKSSKLIKAHAILMCIAWMIFFSTGMLFARYLRDHWPNTRIGGLMLWFHFHRTLNLIGVAATIASLACIFTAFDWRWRGPAAYQTPSENKQWGSIHSILGLLACLLAWTQPLNAVFRCQPGSRLRHIFNMVHRCLGFLAWLLAAAATMIAVVWFKSRFTNSDAAFGIYVAFLAAFGITTIVNEIFYVRKWCQRKERVSSSTDAAMPSVNAKTRIVIGSSFRKMNLIQLIAFLFFALVAIGTSLALCCLLGLLYDQNIENYRST